MFTANRPATALVPESEEIIRRPKEGSTFENCSFLGSLGTSV